MAIEEQVKKATCRVDHKYGQGTAFWVGEDLLMTAAHVTDSAPSNTVNIQTSDGEKLDVEVKTSDSNLDDDPGSDLAILEAPSSQDDYECLSIETNVPSIGTSLVWSGYARLFGEKKLDRQRFGWGKVASEDYGDNGGTFFEVDGLFNPSHSGGPVVNVETGKVVGVVSASAGGFGELEEAWSERVNRLRYLFRLSNQMQQGMGMYQGKVFDDPGEAVRAKQELEALGLTPQTKTREGKMEVSINTDEVPIRAAEVQADISLLLLKTAQETFQMGVGIASGGDALNEMLEPV